MSSTSSLHPNSNSSPPPKKPRPATVLSFEESVLRDPTNVNIWNSYISFTAATHSSPSPQFCLFERALSVLPSSYKLWYQYLTTFQRYVIANFHPLHPSHSHLLKLFSRAVAAFPTSPLLWSFYLDTLLQNAKLDHSIIVLNQALRALPVSQHLHLWRVITYRFPKSKAPKTWATLQERKAYVFRNETAKIAVDALVHVKWYQRAQKIVEICLGDTDFIPDGCTRAELAVAAQGGTVVDSLIHAVHNHRSKKQVDNDHHTEQNNNINKSKAQIQWQNDVVQADPLYASLITAACAQRIRNGQFSSARHLFEQGVQFAKSAREFSIIFDAYVKLEQTLTEAMIASSSSNAEDEDSEEAEQQLNRLENLAKRRPFLLSDVLLRQNPHNVSEWLRRVRLVQRTTSTDQSSSSSSSGQAVVDTYATAVRTIDPARASSGRACLPWLSFANLYKRTGDVVNARSVLRSALGRRREFTRDSDVVSLWTALAETELQSGNLKDACMVLWEAVRSEKQKEGEGEDKTKKKSWSVIWAFLVDVVHAMDDRNDIWQLHTHMLDIGVATSRSIMTGCKFFETRQLFHRALKLYDRAASTIPLFAGGIDLWCEYIKLAKIRYAKTKMERLSEIFETFLRQPSLSLLSSSSTTSKKLKNLQPQDKLDLIKYRRLFFLEYIQCEFEHGNDANRALRLLTRVCQQENNQLTTDVTLHRLRVVRTAEWHGASATRAVYEHALFALTDTEDVAEFATRFAALEERLGETGRARAIFRMTAEGIGIGNENGMCAKMWREWEQFEKRVGTVDDMKDMMRVKKRAELDSGRNIRRGSTSGNSAGLVLRGMVKGGELMSNNEEEQDQEEDGSENKEGDGDQQEEDEEEIESGEKGTIEKVRNESLRTSTPETSKDDEQEGTTGEKFDKSSADIGGLDEIQKGRGKDQIVGAKRRREKEDT